MICSLRYAGFVVIATSALSIVSRERIAVGTEEQDDAARNSSRTSLPDSERLCDGVRQIVCAGAPGPVFPLSEAWHVIAAGDDDKAFPGVFAVVRLFGKGRVAMFGHSGVFVPAAVESLDTGRFLENVSRWLDPSGANVLRFTTGHGERSPNPGGLVARLTNLRWKVSPVPGRISAASLADTSVLWVGDAENDFTAEEIEAVRQFVSQGHGLWLVGLGWSWEPYHPGTTLEDYPMSKLARAYEARWLRSGVVGVASHKDMAVLRISAGEDAIVSAKAATKAIAATHSQFPDDQKLADILESDPSVRRSFVRAHSLLAMITGEFPPEHPYRAGLFRYYVRLVQEHPDYYAKTRTCEPKRNPTSAWLRERVWRAWRDAVELTDAGKSEMIEAGRLSGLYRELLEKWGVVILDNKSLDQTQLDFLVHYFTVTPPELNRGLKSISVVDFLGKSATPVSLDGQPWGVNIFGVRIAQARENSFPADVPAGEIAVFCGCAVHEVNHVVDAAIVGPSARLNARKNQLIKGAGDEPLNYLRSMLEPGFFARNPQEFFASLSNEWFSDSEKTVMLGLRRFDSGRRHPINQALFFADVYSRGTENTVFFRADTKASIRPRTIPLHRDDKGRIDGILLGDGWHRFELDEGGRVVSHRVDKSHP
jgi:hypothetical protein